MGFYKQVLGVMMMASFSLIGIKSAIASTEIGLSDNGRLVIGQSKIWNTKRVSQLLSGGDGYVLQDITKSRRTGDFISVVDHTAMVIDLHKSGPT